MDIKDRRTALERARHEQQKAEAAVAARDSKARELDEAAEQARRKVEAAEREQRQSEEAELRARLEKAEIAERETREGLAGALAVIAKLADEARGAQGDANRLRTQLGIPVARDLVEATVLAALVESGLVDARAVGTPLTALRRLDPSREDERRRRAELDRAAREEGDRRYYEREDVIRHEVEVLDKRIRDYRAELRAGSSKAVRDRLNAVLAERATWVEKAERLGVEIDEAAA